MINRSIILLFLIPLVSCTEKIGNQILSSDKWSLIEYHYSRGPVSPEYQYNYDVILNNDGSCVYSFRKGEDKTLETFSLSEAEFESLNEIIIEADLFSREIPSLPDSEIPDGGSRQWMVIVIENTDPDLDQPPRRIEIPVYPEKKYKEQIEKVYTKINDLIPENIKQQN